MATVEQCETQTSGLGALSSTLDLFDSYKPLQEEEKDSDEESFHLPMLDCDDDLDSSSKEVATSGINKDTHDETEDDILNKFETTGTPDLDPKIEDTILEDIEELCEKKPSSQTSNKETSQKENTSNKGEEAIMSNEELTKDKPINNCINSDSSKIVEATIEENREENILDEKQKEVEQQEKEKVVEQNILVEDIKESEQEHTDNESNETNDLVKVSTDCKEFENEPENNTKIAEVDKIIEDELSVPNKIDPADSKTEIEANAGNDSTIEEELSQLIETSKEEKIADTDDKNKETEKESTCVSENVPVENEEVAESCANLSEKMDVDSEELKTDHPVEEVENTPNKIEDNKADDPTVSNDLKEKDNFKAMDTENTDNEEMEGIKVSEDVKGSDKENSTDKTGLGEDSLQREIIDEDKLLQECDDEINKESDMEKQPESTSEKETTAANDSKTDTTEPEKCENSNDSNKSQNLDCDDLLDISIIRDADEDNASAIAENANDNQSSEKSDNDDQDDGSEKAENELDESEMDQEDSLLVTDKDDNMDFEDGNSSNLCDQDNTTSGNTSDSETKDDVDMRDSSETDSKGSSSVLKEKTDETDKIELESEKTQTEKRKDVDSEASENQDSVKENSLKLSGKRSLSETDKNAEVISKKIKLSEHQSTEEKKSPSKNNKVKTLITFEKYMQNKKLKTKLSRSDLEQFCLQKICEAIMHKTDVGELHQTIKKQEQIIENLRKDLQQLTKQTRDLDIVNKKLMNELRAQNGNKKPLVPLKITRSVGLQVKLNLSTENTTRRKVPIPTTPRTPNTPNTPARPRTILPTNTSVVRQVAASPRKTPTATPLLSQALQNRQPSPANTIKRTPIRPKPAEPQKPASQSVIDLTDEDDKAAKTIGNHVKILNKAIPQGKTINIVPAKTIPNKTINSNQNKTVAVGQVKTATVGAKVGAPTRTVTTLPQGVRLTPTQVKNGSITIPASVVTSNSGTTQLMYVVQPTSSLGQVVTTTAGGAQKAVLLNFQPANGVLTSALNGSAVSVIPTKTTNTVQLKTVAAPRKHPAPLPLPPAIATNATLKPLLPKPHLSIRKTDTGIILQWRMPYNLEIYEGIASYQLFAYQETNAAPSTEMWRKVGDVKALALPMACTLTQFADKNKYYFAVRSVDVHKRIGAFSDPEEISL